MVKQKFSSMDVAAMVSCMRHKLRNHQVANVYDLAGSKSFLLKLKHRNRNNKIAGTEYQNIILEPSIRFHVTKFDREKAAAPSSATMKLRKHLRNMRLEDVEQIGLDRIVMFTFVGGPERLHLILELFVRGSLVLCDSEMKVLFRSVTYEYATNHAPVGTVYKMETQAMKFLINPEIASEKDPSVPDIDKLKDFASKFIEKQKATGEGTGKKKNRQKRNLKLETLLLQCMYCAHPSLCAYAIRKCGSDPNLNLMEMDEGVIADILKKGTLECLEVFKEVISADAGEKLDDGKDDCDDGNDESNLSSTVSAEKPIQKVSEIRKLCSLGKGKLKPESILPGYILTNTKAQGGLLPPATPSTASYDDKPKLNYEDFSPVAYLLSCNDGKDGDDVGEKLTFDDFSVCVDQFFSQLEIQKKYEAQGQQKNKVLSRVERIKRDHQERVEKMLQMQHDADLKAALLEENLQLVDDCILMLNTGLKQGIDWNSLWQEIKLQQGLGHPRAQHIHSLQLAKSQFTILLEDTVTPDEEESEAAPQKRDSADDLFSDDEDEEQAPQKARQDLPMVTLTIDLTLSAYGNVAKLHSNRKATKAKSAKTEAASGKVVKQAAKKAQNEVAKLARDHKVANLREVRNLTWFEQKFSWFISSENYLCLQGRDVTTQEMLLKRYMSFERDVIVDSECDGSLCVLIKNPHKNQPVSPLTMQEAAVFCLSKSSAWAKKEQTGCWYVKGDQIKLPSLEIQNRKQYYGLKYGEKIHLPPSKLEMGYCLLFEVDEASSVKHIGERKIRSGDVVIEEENIEEEVAKSDSEDEKNEDEENEGGGISVDDIKLEEGDDQKPDESKVKSDESDGKPTDNDDEEEETKEETKASDGDDETKREVDPKNAPEHGSQGAVAHPDASQGDAGAADSEKATGSKGKKPRNPNKVGGQEHGNEKIEKKEKQQPVVVPRGQKAKIKKMKKYELQDEEERAIKMQLTGAKLKKSEQKAGEEKNQDGDHAQDGDHGRAGKGKGKNKGKGGKEGGKAHTIIEKTPEELQEERLTIQKALDRNAMSVLHPFTGQPHYDDTVVRCVPMCAPFSSLKNYYCKVKLTPGGQAKKGKINQMAQHLFFGDANYSEMMQILNSQSRKKVEDKDDGTLGSSGTPGSSESKEGGSESKDGGSECKNETEERDEKPEPSDEDFKNKLLHWKQMMEAIPDTEIMNAIISNSQIQAAGIQKVQKQMKKDQVKKAKDKDQMKKQQKKK